MSFGLCLTNRSGQHKIENPFGQDFPFSGRGQATGKKFLELFDCTCKFKCQTS